MVEAAQHKPFFFIIIPAIEIIYSKSLQVLDPLLRLNGGLAFPQA